MLVVILNAVNVESIPLNLMDFRTHPMGVNRQMHMVVEGKPCAGAGP